MCHSTCVKICFEGASGCKRIGSNPNDRVAATASACERTPSNPGSSHMDAKSPLDGLRRIASLPSISSNKIVFRSTRRGGFGFLTGNCSSFPMRCAAQKSATGHKRQWGAACGMQTNAPSSINAWLKSPLRVPGIMGSKTRSVRFLTAGLEISESSAVRRIQTRRTFPSTAGTGCPKAMDATAPAV